MPERFTLQKPELSPDIPDIDDDNGLNAPAITRQELRGILLRRAEHAEILDADYTNNENTRQLLSELPPVSSVNVDGRNFHFSNVFSNAFDETGRKHAVGYTVLKDGNVAPRLFYKSKSDGFWRVSPYIDQEVDESGNVRQYYSKGETMHDGYVRETRIHDDIAGHLEQKEATAVQFHPEYMNKVRDHFSTEKLGDTFTYNEEAFGVKLNALKDFFVYTPGDGFVSEATQRPAREVLEELKVDEQLKADFTQAPAKKVQRTHSMLGDVTIESYPSKDGRLLWNMARTTNGIVWVNGLTSAPDRDGPVSSYGTDYEVVLAGVLDNKPIEYVSQLRGLEEDKDYVRIPGTSYAHLTVLDNLEPIREYKEAHAEHALAV